eukprot:COSAG01_NODE_28132_length_668_cov_1.001757_1_plen_30_part_10
MIAGSADMTGWAGPHQHGDLQYQQHISSSL